MSVPAWKQSEADVHLTMAQEIDGAIDALENIEGIYRLGSASRRHEFRSFIDQLRVDSSNHRSAAQRITGVAAA